VKPDRCGTFVEEMVYDLCYFYQHDTRLSTPIRYSQRRAGLDPRPLYVTFTVKNVALGHV
jgi:hypothetical protein